MLLKRKVLTALASGVIVIGCVSCFSAPSRAQQEPAASEPATEPASPSKPARKTKHQQKTEQAEQGKKIEQAEQKKPEPAPPQPPEQAKPTEPAQSAAAQPPAGQTPSVFDDHVRQGKIVTCANVFSTLGRGVAGNSPFAAKTQWDSKASDAHAVESIVALDGDPSNPSQKAAGIVFAAPNGHACEGALVRVTPTKDNCAAMAAALAKINGQTGALGDLTVMTLPNGAQVMLVPFGEACVAVTTLRASS